MTLRGLRCECLRLMGVGDDVDLEGMSREQLLADMQLAPYLAGWEGCVQRAIGVLVRRGIVSEERGSALSLLVCGGEDNVELPLWEPLCMSIPYFVKAEKLQGENTDASNRSLAMWEKAVSESAVETPVWRLAHKVY